MISVAVLMLSGVLGGQALEPGDHQRTLTTDGRERSYVVHIPKQYDASTPSPVVLVFHGAASNPYGCMWFTGMSTKSDEAGFVAVYPNGVGAGLLRVWNAGARTGPLADELPDDVKYVDALLDDLATVMNVDPRRVYATGCSNGGMMCYRVAAELSHRIAAIAPVAGPMALDEARPGRPVPVMHFHGTADPIVPFDGPAKGTPEFLTFKSVEETISIWRRINGCPEKPTVMDHADKVADGTTVKQFTYGPGKDGAEVVLIEIQGGGHTWPGRKPPVKFIGKSTFDISASDLIWAFFQKHPMPERKREDGAVGGAQQRHESKITSQPGDKETRGPGDQETP
ncbi:MAG: esterase [Phycisphaerae bacterium]